MHFSILQVTIYAVFPEYILWRMDRGSNSQYIFINFHLGGSYLVWV